MVVHVWKPIALYSENTNLSDLAVEPKQTLNTNLSTLGRRALPSANTDLPNLAIEPF